MIGGRDTSNSSVCVCYCAFMCALCVCVSVHAYNVHTYVSILLRQHAANGFLKV